MLDFFNGKKTGIGAFLLLAAQAVSLLDVDSLKGFIMLLEIVGSSMSTIGLGHKIKKSY